MAQPVYASGTFHCSIQVYNHFACIEERSGKTWRRSMMLSQGVWCCSWDLRMPKTWDEAEEEGVEPPRHRVLREQRFWGVQCMQTWRKWARSKWRWEKGWGSQLIILIPQTFDFRIHCKGLYFISFSFRDLLIPRPRIVPYLEHCFHVKGMNS